MAHTYIFEINITREEIIVATITCQTCGVKVEKIANDNPYSKETVLTENIPVANSADRMGIPSSSQIGPYINGTIHLFECEISQEDAIWKFYNLIIINNSELLQYYRFVFVH